MQLNRWQKTLWWVWLGGTLLPLLVLVVWSLAQRWFFPAWWPPGWGLHAWTTVLAPHTQALQATTNSFYVAFWVMLLAVGLGYPLGALLGQGRFVGQGVLRWLVLLPLVFPPLAYGMGLQGVLLRLGLEDSYTGLVLAHLVPALPYAVLSMASQWSHVPPEMGWQARTLGASAFMVFWRVELPALLPGVLAGALLAALVSWSQYVLSLLVAGGHIPTLPQLVFAYASGMDRGRMAAMTLLLVLPPLLLLVPIVWLEAKGGAERPQAPL